MCQRNKDRDKMEEKEGTTDNMGERKTQRRKGWEKIIQI